MVTGVCSLVNACVYMSVCVCMCLFLSHTDKSTHRHAHAHAHAHARTSAHAPHPHTHTHTHTCIYKHRRKHTQSWRQVSDLDCVSADQKGSCLPSPQDKSTNHIDKPLKPGHTHS